jgi:ribonuclease R
VHVTSLGQDYFQYDEVRHELRGERTGKRFALTDRVTVQVARVDLEARKIDLVLAAASNEMSTDQVRSRASSPAQESKSAKKSRRSQPEPGAPSRYQVDMVEEADIEVVKPPRRVRTSKTTTAATKNSAKKTAPKKAAKTVSKTSRKKT